MRIESRVAGVEQPVVLVARGVGMVAERLHPERHRRPRAMQVDPRLAEKRASGGHVRIADAFRDVRLWAFAVAYFCGVMCFYAVNFWMPTNNFF